MLTFSVVLTTSSDCYKLNAYINLYINLLYSVGIQENADQKNFKYGHFLRNSSRDIFAQYIKFVLAWYN